MFILPNKWYVRFLKMAEHIAEWSKDPSTKIGAVIVDKKRRIVGIGYNGFARGVHDSEERYNNRDEKYDYIVHGEINAILNSTDKVEGCTLYTIPIPPCVRCAGIVIQSGIKRVVTWYEGLSNPRWNPQKTEMMFGEAGVRLDSISRFSAIEEPYKFESLPTTNQTSINSCLHCLHPIHFSECGVNNCICFMGVMSK